MTPKTSKPLCLLLDASIIIQAHRLDIWSFLVDSFDIIVSSIIARDEALFSQKRPGSVPQSISLPSFIKSGKITELSASASEMALLSDLFDRVFLLGLHDGEKEALTLLNSNKVEGAQFCTSDGNAIQALAMIGMSENGICFESLLESIGITKDLPRQYQSEFFKKHIRTGQENRILGQGIK